MEINELTIDLSAQVLDLSGKDITEAVQDKIRQMTALTHLDLQDTNINSLSFLKPLTNLKELDISGTKIGDFSKLSKLVSLETLVAHDVAVYDLSPLEKLNKLRVLQMERTEFNDVTPLGKIDSLQEIDLYGNENLADIKPLAKLKNLKALCVKGTKINSPYQLECLFELETLETLSVNVELEGLADAIVQRIKEKAAFSHIFSESSERIDDLDVKEVFERATKSVVKPNTR